MRRVLEEAEEVKQPGWVDRMVEGGVKVSRDRSCRTERLMCIRKRLGLGSPTIGYLHFLSNFIIATIVGKGEPGIFPSRCR